MSAERPFAGALDAARSSRRPDWDGAMRAGSSVRIHAERQPRRPVKVAVPLTSRLPRDAFAVVAARSSSSTAWEPLPATVSADRRTMRFAAPHFSWFTPLWLDVQALVRELKRQFDGATSGAFAEAEQPSCPDEAGARLDGWSVASSGPDTIKWCFGRRTDGTRLVTVTNARRYPLSVHHPGARTIKAPSVGLFDPARISQLMTPGVTMLQPRASVTYSLSSSARIRTEFDGLAHSLYSLEIGAELAATLLTRFGSEGPATLKGKIADALLRTRSCLDSLGQLDNGGALIKNCFHAGQLKEALGAKGVLLAAFMSVSQVAEYFRSALNGLGDIVRGRDRYLLAVDHAAPPAPDASAWRFDQDHYGPARIAMTIAEAQAALGVQLENGGGLGVCWTLTGDQAREVIFVADAPNSRAARVSAIVSNGERAETTKGLRVGDQLSRAAELYGSQYHDTGNRVTQGIAASIFDEGWANALGIYVHGPDDERISGFVAGEASEEYCA